MLSGNIELARTKKGKSRPITAGKIRHVVREAEKASGVGATGYTLLKMRVSPVAWLLNARRIGPEEYRAAQDISTAFFAKTAGVGFKPLSMERRDPSYGREHPSQVLDAIANYDRWAWYWSIRAKMGDPTLEIVIAAVVDERSLHQIDDDVRIKHGRSAKAVVCGLRDYAARSGWLEKAREREWKGVSVFHVEHPDLRLAILQAKRGGAQ